MIFAIFFIGIFRALVGLFAWIVPVPSLSLFGVVVPTTKQTAATPEIVFLGRLFGVRDFLLGSILLYFGYFAADHNVTIIRLVLQIGFFVDIMDTIAGAIGYIQGLNWKAMTNSVFGAFVFALVALFALL